MKEFHGSLVASSRASKITFVALLVLFSLNAFGQTFGRPDHPLGSFQVGIGVAHGRAVARVLDDLHVAALAGPLEAEEHGPSLSSTTESDS